MPAFGVSVTIENKPGIADPEGSTILNDLVLRGGSSPVSDVRTAKVLRFTVEAGDGDGAEAEVRRLCDELRVYNPLVSRATYRVTGPGGGPDPGP